MSLALTACSQQQILPSATTTVTSSPSYSQIPTPSPTIKPDPIDLTKPGEAIRIINKMMSQVDDFPVLKVDISKNKLTIAFLKPDKQVVAYSWQKNKAVKVDSDVEYFGQQTFEPRLFNLYDVGSLFNQARQLGATGQYLQLQIVEYDPGQVLMAVTTRPESTTVFFHRDGTPVAHLDYEILADLEVGLKETIADRNMVYQVGVNDSVGIWADIPNVKNTSLRRIRKEKLPTYSTPHQKPSLETFDAHKIQPAVIHNIKQRIRTVHELSDETPIMVVIDIRYPKFGPTMTFAFKSKTLVTDLAGNNLTGWVN